MSMLGFGFSASFLSGSVLAGPLGKLLVVDDPAIPGNVFILVVDDPAIPGNVFELWQRDIPAITTPATISVAENAPLSILMSATETVIWGAVTGADAAHIEIFGNVIRWLSNGTKDYDSASDAGANNIFDLTLNAMTADGIPLSKAVAVTVTNVDDIPPVITIASSVSLPESDPLALVLTADKLISSWLIVGGADADQFTITANVLDFDTVRKDYENPTDTGANNVYNVTLQAVDTAGNISAPFPLAVTITDVIDPGGLWTPTSLADTPLYWYDAQDSATLSTSSNKVLSWLDKGSGGINLSQATTANQPTLVASSNISGLPAVRFDGTNDLLVGAFGSTVDTVLNSFRCPGDITHISVELLDGAVVSTFLSASLTSLTTACLIEVVWDTSTISFFRNGVAVGTANAATGFAKEGSLFAAVRYATAGGANFGRLLCGDGVGNRTALDRSIDGDLGELLYLDYTPSQADREYIEGYMAHRFGLQAGLPGTHPYAVAAPVVGGSPVMTFSVSPGSVSQIEGDSGTTLFQFIITRSGVTTGTASVAWTTAGIGANPANAADFGGTFPSGSVDFLDGETTKTVGVLVSGDTSVEANETFAMSISTSDGAVSVPSATVTILNNDAGTVPGSVAVSFGAKTRRGHGGADLGFALTPTITGGDPTGIWTIDSRKHLVLAGTYGNAPPALSGPYTLTITDGTNTVTAVVSIVANVAHWRGVNTGLNLDSGATSQIRTLLSTAGAVARGDTLYLRDGSAFNPTCVDSRIRPPAALYAGTGRITIKSETPFGANFGKIIFDSQVMTAAGEVPVDFVDINFVGFSTTSANLTAEIVSRAGVRKITGVSYYNCRVTTDPGSPYPVSGLVTFDNGAVSGCFLEDLYDGITTTAANCFVSNNEYRKIQNDCNKGQPVDINYSDNFMIDKEYYGAIAHGDYYQDAGVLGTPPQSRSVGTHRRNIMARGTVSDDTQVDGQGLFFNDTLAGNSLLNLVIEENIYIGTFVNGISMSRATNPVVNRNTAIFNVFAVNIPTPASTQINANGGTGGTFTNNVALGYSLQSGATSSNNATLARTIAAYRAAFQDPDRALAATATKADIIAGLSPILGGPLRNVDGTYQGALFPDGRWNDGSVYA